MHLDEIVSTPKSLQELIAASPDTWTAVFASVKERVESGRMDSLAALALENKRFLETRVLPKCSLNQQDPHIYHAAVRARMTIMAIEQFTSAVTGNVGQTASIKDQWILRWLVMPSLNGGLETGKIWSCLEFDKRWNRLRDKGWAAGQIQRAGYWNLPTSDLIERFIQHAAGRPILEIGAGKGILARGLQRAGASVTAVDDQSWQKSDQSFEKKSIVVRGDAGAALKEFSPSVVICSWPPPGNCFEREVFQTRSVQIYLAIVSRHRFASGDWNAYQQQRTFACTTSEPLNELLRPRECEQQVLIFRRK